MKDKPCVYCGATENITIEHIIPKSWGGCNHDHNTAPACFDCNQARGNMPLEKFLETRPNANLNRLLYRYNEAVNCILKSNEKQIEALERSKRRIDCQIGKVRNHGKKMIDLRNKIKKRKK